MFMFKERKQPSGLFRPTRESTDSHASRFVLSKLNKGKRVLQLSPLQPIHLIDLVLPMG